MSSVAISHKHRHYKTLILLVVSMTAGTIFLFWLGNLSPVTPLRAGTRVAPRWTNIAVRPVQAGQEAGAFHLRIDDRGRTFQMQRWDEAWQAHRARGEIQIVLNLREGATSLTKPQRGALSRLLADLGRRHGISDQQVRLIAQAPAAPVERIESRS